jgi:hypothetical protein
MKGVDYMKKSFNAVLYSIRGDHVVSMEGELTMQYEGLGPTTTFRSYKDDARKYRFSDRPGVVQSGILWLYKRDDELARKLLIEHEELQIRKLHKQIDQHKQIIEKIKNEL